VIGSNVEAACRADQTAQRGLLCGRVAAQGARPRAANVGVFKPIAF
jgi:hypothetical protein